MSEQLNFLLRRPDWCKSGTDLCCLLTNSINRIDLLYCNPISDISIVILTVI
jgi:hypothetical protein